MIILGLLTCTAVNGVDDVDSIKIKVNDEVFDVKLEDNSAARELVRTLESGNVTVNATEYGGFEKVGDLGFSLPTSDENINTSPGDLVLYQGNQISLFYDSHSWSYTKLGKIDNVDSNHLKEVLGSGDVTIVLSLK
ncbi:MAG: cyclophilin-like fold protein [Methanobrevibacter sp.]|nr:cyclophilin-like fold protein [Methanobrevibacter sp.]